MKKLLAVVAVLAPALTLLPAAPASADNVCLPITIDGQPVCQDTAPVDQAVVQAEATAAEVADELLTLVADGEGLAIGVVRSVAGPEYDGTTYCDSVSPMDDGVIVTVGTFGPLPSPHAVNDIGQCDSYQLTIKADAGIGGTIVHVPEVCLTTTGTCVGGINTTVPTPAVSYTVCLQEVTSTVVGDGNGGTSSYPTSTGPATCLPAA